MANSNKKILAELAANPFVPAKKLKFNKPTRVWSEISDGITQVWGTAPAKEADYIIVPAKGYKITKIKK